MPNDPPHYQAKRAMSPSTDIRTLRTTPLRAPPGSDMIFKDMHLEPTSMDLLQQSGNNQSWRKHLRRDLLRSSGVRSGAPPRTAPASARPISSTVPAHIRMPRSSNPYVQPALEPILDNKHRARRTTWHDGCDEQPFQYLEANGFRAKARRSTHMGKLSPAMFNGLGGKEIKVKIGVRQTSLRKPTPALPKIQPMPKTSPERARDDGHPGPSIQRGCSLEGDPRPPGGVITNERAGPTSANVMSDPNPPGAKLDPRSASVIQEELTPSAPAAVSASANHPPDPFAAKFEQSGVSLAFLDQFARGVPAGYTSREAMERVVAPRTRAERCAYVDTMTERNGMLASRGAPHYYVCHVWDGGFRAMVGRVLAELKGCDPDNTFVWLDLFAVNPHADEAACARLEEAERCVVRAERGVLVVWEPRVLTRAWCVFELWVALHQLSPGCIRVASGPISLQDIMRCAHALSPQELRATRADDGLEITRILENRSNNGLQGVRSLINAFFKVQPVYHSVDLIPLHSQPLPDQLAARVADWKQSDARCLWISGPDGRGKSTLSKMLLQKGMVHAIHSVRANCAQSQDADSLVRNVAFQLALQFSVAMGDYFLELSVNSALSQTNSFDTFLVLPLQTLTRFYHNTKGGNAGQLPEVVILIDGIDAINLIASGTNSGGRDLLSMLCAEIYHLPINVKLIVTGAWDPWIAHKLSSAFHPLSQLELEKGTLASADEVSVKELADRTFCHAHLQMGSKKTVQQVASGLDESSRGSLLYWTLLNKLADMDGVNVSRLLLNPPESMHRLYQSYLFRICYGSETSNEEWTQVQVFLALLVASKEPLTVERAHRCGVRNIQKVVLPRLGGLVRVCAGRILPLHCTVFVWLHSLTVQSPLPHLTVNLASGHALLARMLLEDMASGNGSNVDYLCRYALAHAAESDDPDKYLHALLSNVEFVRLVILHRRGTSMHRTLLSIESSLPIVHDVRNWLSQDFHTMLKYPKAVCQLAYDCPYNTHFAQQLRKNDISCRPLAWLVSKSASWAPYCKVCSLCTKRGVVTSATTTRNAQLLVCGLDTGEVLLYDTLTKDLLAIMEDHEGAILDVDVSADQQFIISLGSDHTVRKFSVADAGRQITCIQLFEVNSSHHLREAHEETGDTNHQQISSQDRSGAEMTTDTVKITEDVEVQEQILGNSPIHAPTDDQRSDGCVIRKPARAAYVSTEGQYALASDDHHGFVVWKVCLDETLPEDTPPCAVQFEVTMDEASEEVQRVNCLKVLRHKGLQYVAAGSTDGIVRLWAFHTGGLQERFEAHSGAVVAMDVAPDMKWLVSGGEDCRIMLWNVNLQMKDDTDDTISKVLQSADPVHKVAFAGEERIVIATAASSIRIWSTSSNAQRLVETGTGPIQSLNICKDAALMVCGHGNGSVCALQLGSCEDEERSRKETMSEFIGLALSSNNRYVASVSTDGTVRTWDVEKGSQLMCTTTYQESIFAICWYPDSQHLLIGGGDSKVRKIEAMSGLEVKNWSHHSDAIQAVAVSKNSLHMASGSKDTTVRVYDIRFGNNKVVVLKGYHTASITCIEFVPGKEPHLVSGSEDSSLRVWNIITGSLLTSMQGHSSAVMSLSMSEDGQFVVSGSKDGTMRVWYVPRGTELRCSAGGFGHIRSVRFLSENQRIISSGDDGLVWLWDYEKGEETAMLKGHSNIVSALCVTTNTNIVYSASADKTIRAWDIGRFNRHSKQSMFQEVHHIHRCGSILD